MKIRIFILSLPFIAVFGMFIYALILSGNTKLLFIESANKTCEYACRPYEVRICEVDIPSEVRHIKAKEAICYTKDDGVFISQHVK